MKITEIQFAHEITSSSDSLDVFVTTSCGHTHTIVVSTPDSLLSEMGDDGFIRPHTPRIIVKKLTRQIITEAIYAYAEPNNGYWIKLCQFGD